MADAMAEDEPAGGDEAIAPAHALSTWISRKRANDKYKACCLSRHLKYLFERDDPRGSIPYPTTPA